MTRTLYTKNDSRNLPAYAPQEAAHYLGLPASTVRVWAVGQAYRTQRQGPQMAAPLLRVARKSPLALSFWNLVELYVLRSIRRQHAISMSRVRRALNYVERSLDLQRPLIEQEFLTDGVDLFIERYGALVKASESGQMALKDLMQGTLQRIDRDPSGLPRRFFPWLNDPLEPRAVEIDPTKAFGRLVVAGTAIPTESLVERFVAGDSPDLLAHDYRLPPEVVWAALRWETGVGRIHGADLRS